MLEHIDEGEKMANKNKLGLLSICLLGVNAIVGTGIFLLPGKAAKLVGVASIGVIAFDALLVILLALCFAEAGGLFKKNGGRTFMHVKHSVNLSALKSAL